VLTHLREVVDLDPAPLSVFYLLDVEPQLPVLLRGRRRKMILSGKLVPAGKKTRITAAASSYITN